MVVGFGILSSSISGTISGMGNGFTMRARMEVLRVYGSTLSPFSAWQILQGVESLHVRMERHCTNTRKVAEFLKNHPHHQLTNWLRHLLYIGFDFE